MILTNEEKRTVWIAAGGGAAVLLIYFAGLPLWKRWTALGAALEPKALLMARLEERAKAQNALIARRDSLASELGAVEGRPAPAGPAQGMPPMPRPPAAEKPGPSKSAMPGASGSAAAATGPVPHSPAAARALSGLAGPGAAPPVPGTSPHAVTVAAYVERLAASVGVRFNNVTPFTSTLGYRGGKSLTPAGVMVTLETATPALLQLLYKLEKGDRLMRVEKMDIHRDIKKGPMVTATLYIVGYEAAAR
jgi:hypothetical protein